MKQIKDIFFSYGGTYAMYMYIGVLRALEKNRDMIDVANCRLYGCSAGAAFAFLYLLVIHQIITIDDIEYEFNQTFTTPGEFPSDLTPIAIRLLQRIFDTYIRDRDVLSLVKGHLYIGISLEHRFKFIRKFESKQDLCHALMLSGNIPLMSSYYSVYKGRVALDGGVNFRLAFLPKNTVVIYNTTYFPEACKTPTEEKKQELIDGGEYFVKRRIRHIKKYGRQFIDSDIYINEHTMNDSIKKILFCIQRFNNAKINTKFEF